MVPFRILGTYIPIIRKLEKIKAPSRYVPFKIEITKGSLLFHIFYCQNYLQVGGNMVGAIPHLPPGSDSPDQYYKFLSIETEEPKAPDN